MESFLSPVWRWLGERLTGGNGVTSASNFNTVTRPEGHCQWHSLFVILFKCVIGNDWYFHRWCIKPRVLLLFWTRPPEWGLAMCFIDIPHHQSRMEDIMIYWMKNESVTLGKTGGNRKRDRTMICMTAEQRRVISNSYQIRGTPSTFNRSEVNDSYHPRIYFFIIVVLLTLTRTAKYGYVNRRDINDKDCT